MEIIVPPGLKDTINSNNYEDDSTKQFKHNTYVDICYTIQA